MQAINDIHAFAFLCKPLQKEEVEKQILDLLQVANHRDDIEYEFSYVMKKLITELDDYGFAVNCRGNLVNLSHIVKIKGYNIHLDNGKVLTLSQKRAVKFKEKMNQFIQNKI